MPSDEKQGAKEMKERGGVPTIHFMDRSRLAVHKVDRSQPLQDMLGSDL